MSALADANISVTSYLDGVEYRGFKIIQSREFHLFEIHSMTGDPVPLTLIGKFTTLGLVKSAIDDFLERSKSKNDQHSNISRD